jgi:ribosomal protein S18 acetylase RimI-like enzyme
MEISVITPEALRAFFNKEKAERYSEYQNDVDNTLIDDAHEMSFDQGKIYAASEGSRILGFAYVILDVVLYSLYVSPGARSKGVGQRLVEESGVTETMVLRKNERALQFYQRLGFSIYKTLPYHHYLTKGGGTPVVSMASLKSAKPPAGQRVGIWSFWN